MAAEFSRHGVSPEQLHVVPLPVTGVAPDCEAPAGRAYSGMILMVGRLTRLKGADHLIRAVPAAARVLGWPLTIGIAGDGHGPELAALEQLARRTGVDVVFHAWLDVDRRTECMRLADLLAVPSVWPEPFGLVGIEAGCVGLPAVAYDVGGISDWLVPGRSGELAPGDPPTIGGLADAIVRALRDPARHASLRRGAWEVASQFTMTAHMNRLESLLLSVANRRV
jgi:glycosyltransferase involved in cell wall biosynthesis